MKPGDSAVVWRQKYACEEWLGKTVTIVGKPYRVHGSGFILDYSTGNVTQSVSSTNVRVHGLKDNKIISIDVRSLQVIAKVWEKGNWEDCVWQPCM